MSGVFPGDSRALDAWAARPRSQACRPERATKFATGQSNPTYLLEALPAAAMSCGESRPASYSSRRI